MLPVFAVIITTPAKLPAVTFADSKTAYVLARDVAKAKNWKLTFDPLTRLSTLNGKDLPVDLPTLFNGGVLVPAAEYWPEVEIGKKRAEIDLGKQSMVAWQGPIIVMKIKINSGALQNATPPGNYLTGGKKIDKVSSIYGSKMPYSVHLKGNYFIHGADVTLSGPGSHGCIRLPMYNHAAEWFYDWVDAGTPVTVTGRRPSGG
jgi:hypothetical protein